MTPASREYYGIDALWERAECVDLSGVLTPDDGLLDDADLLDEDEDDFWDSPPPGADDEEDDFWDGPPSEADD